MKQQLGIVFLNLLFVGVTALADTADDKAQHSYDRDPAYGSAPVGIDVDDSSMKSSRPVTSKPSDLDLQAMARRNLQRDLTLSSDARSVNVRVHDGRATLQGFVDSSDEAEALRRKVLAIPGINSVSNKTSIRE